MACLARRHCALANIGKILWGVRDAERSLRQIYMAGRMRMYKFRRHLQQMNKWVGIVFILCPSKFLTACTWMMWSALGEYLITHV